MDIIPAKPRNLHVLLMFVWVSFDYSDFPPHIKYTLRLISFTYKLTFECNYVCMYALDMEKYYYHINTEYLL